MSESNLLEYQSIFNKKKSNVIQSVPINTNSFGYIIYNNQLETVFKCDSQTFSNLDIQLVDDNDIPIDMNNEDIIIELELYSTSPFL